MNSFSNLGVQAQNPGRSLPETYRFVAKALTKLIVMCAGLILADRLFFSSFLHKLLPSHWPMKTNAALGLLLAGIALWLRQSQPPGSRLGKLPRYFGVFIFGLGVITFYQYVFSYARKGRLDF